MNRLAAESSPYLRQHADNPVDWYPWGQEAFDRARDEDRPIFLSIGYSTCHWCHVMAHESFENPAVADALNRDFVSIKVDREERPDVDRVYMSFVQATTGSGGWPMSVWLTSDLKPFYGGTYFPPSAHWGRPGFLDVLAEIARVWTQERDKVEESAGSIVQRLQQMVATSPAGRIPAPETLGTAVAQFRQAFDARRGGFGGAPKFPRPAELFFLLREHARAGDESAREMVLTTLRAMAVGGMRDHVGGGFHRYSVDADWRVPHFEKMLYDQAQLVLAYLEAAQGTGDPFYAAVAEDTLQYVRREMTDPGGAFYSAEDADSVPPEASDAAPAHPTEGAFYLWREAEVRELLGEDANPVIARFGIQAQGNAPADPQGEFVGKNLLYQAQTVEAVATASGLTAAEAHAALERGRLRLFEARLQRPRPYLDDKVLTAWNGLMIAAFARAARVLDAPSHLESAERAARFLRETMWDAARQVLRRRYRDGAAGIDGYAEDYACLVWGLLELFQAGGRAEWLAWALELQARLDDGFWDAGSGGGWFATSGADPSVLLRMKEEYDGAEPSAGSVGAWNLFMLAQLTGEVRFRERLEQVLMSVGGKLPQLARALPMMLAALSMYHGRGGQLVVVDAPAGGGAPPGTAGARPLWQAFRQQYLPGVVCVPVGSGPAREPLVERLPWIRSLEMQDHATAFLCRDGVCRLPATDEDTLTAQLLEVGRESS